MNIKLFLSISFHIYKKLQKFHMFQFYKLLLKLVGNEEVAVHCVAGWRIFIN